MHLVVPRFVHGAFACRLLQIVFSDAVWVGHPADNPDEDPLPLPPELAAAAEGGEGQAQLLHEAPADYAYGAGKSGSMSYCSCKQNMARIAYISSASHTHLCAF